MPRKSGRLTTKEITFVKVMAETDDPTYAAAQAGYSSPQPRGSQNMGNPAIQAAVRDHAMSIMLNELLPASNRVLREALAEKSTAPWGSKLDAVKIVHKRVFGDQDTGAGRSPAEMSPAELAATLDRLQRELADRSKLVVEHEPSKDISPKPSVFE